MTRTAEEIQLREVRAQYTTEQVRDFDDRQMGSSVSLIWQWERESIECAPGGPVDQRMAAINVRNGTLPERVSGPVIKLSLIHI